MSFLSKEEQDRIKSRKHKNSAAITESTDEKMKEDLSPEYRDVLKYRLQNGSNPPGYAKQKPSQYREKLSQLKEETEYVDALPPGTVRKEMNHKEELMNALKKHPGMEKYRSYKDKKTQQFQSHLEKKFAPAVTESAVTRHNKTLAILEQLCSAYSEDETAHLILKETLNTLKTL